ncbi:DUF3221 domain-containing protein [Chryseomicrobium palamuruense]|uniref:DUF3221 domain-containing protein n=1 Tax=Chryseomicrobium palamuruense TaxID=682973 RepID=A0ABV8UVY0_9BACL
MSGKKLAVGLVAGVVIMVGLIMIAVISFFNANPTQDAAEGTNEFTGYIIAMEDERILVVSGTEDEVSGLTNETILDSRLPAIWFSVTMDQRKELEVGEEVRVTHNGVEDSYPGQSAAVTVEPTIGLDH